MKTLFFPFTWMPESHLEALLRHFRSPVVLVPVDVGIDPRMARSHEAGRIVLETPFCGDGDRLAGLLKSYQTWAEVHQGGDIAIARIMEGGIPFFDDSHVARIRSEIRQGRCRTDEPLDRLTRARIFLQMAEQFDRQSLEIETDLDQLQTLEAAMLADLHEGAAGPQASSGVARPRADDLGRFMAEERIRAWARLFLASGLQRQPETVFATTSPTVWEAVIDALADGEATITAAVDAPGAEAAEEVAAALCAERRSREDTTAGGHMLSFCFAPDVAPEPFFARFLKTAPPPAGGVEPAAGLMLALVATTF